MSFRRVVSLLLLAAYLPACTIYQATSQPLAELTAAPKPVERVRVTTLEGSRIQVWSPRVAGDSLVGFTKPGGRTETRIALALTDIWSTEVQEVDTALTVGGVVLGAVAVFGVFTYLSAVYLCDGDGIYC